MIQEFWTFVTDLVLMAISWFFAWSLYRNQRSRVNLSARFWVLTFVAIGVAALQGAISHGFKDSLGAELHLILRVSTLWTLSVTSFLLSMALLKFALNQSSHWLRLGTALLIVKGIVFIGLATVHIKFLLAILDYGSAFVLALVIHGRHFRHPASPQILMGVVVSIGAALVQALKISPSEHFNHNDLYHVVQILGLYLFFEGTKKLTDAGASVSST